MQNTKNYFFINVSLVLLALVTGCGSDDAKDPIALDNACTTAQQIVATTNLTAQKVLLEDWEGFVQADARPYSVVPFPPTPDYEVEEEPDGPLTVAQHTFYNTNESGPDRYPTVVSCKMKNADYLVKTEIDSGSVDKACRSINEFYVGEVINRLTPVQQTSASLDDDGSVDIGEEIILEPDDEQFRGSTWTQNFPESPYSVLYREYEGGPLHVKSRSLYVAANPETTAACNSDPNLQVFSFCTPRKWGVMYCHLPAPEYIQAAITNRATVPILPFGPE